MIEVRQTSAHRKWFSGLRDQRAKNRMVTRIQRLEVGNSGDVKPVGEGISEMRIDYGPGYRLYYVSRATTVIILLCGGDKTSQAADIAKAKALAKQL